MPRKKTTRKQPPPPISETFQAPLNPDDEFERLAAETLNEFDTQVATYTKQVVRKFQTEAKKILRASLPVKSSVPKDILNMRFEDFAIYGGTFDSVKEAIKQEKLLKLSITVKPAIATEPTKATKLASALGPAIATTGPAIATTGDCNEYKEPVLPSTSQAIDPNDFKTPSMRTRSQAQTAKRNPKPKETVEIAMSSTATGSPVNEEAFIQLQLEQCLEGLNEQLAEDMLKGGVPQKWRKNILKYIENIKDQAVKQQNPYTTPAIGRK
ncbi:hypothetical protein EMCRGX_G030977 [Ephydatia muelleri]|eukprot:Em0018g1046a